MVTYRLVRHRGDVSWKDYCMELWAKNQELTERLDKALHENTKLGLEITGLRQQLNQKREQ